MGVHRKENVILKKYFFIYILQKPRWPTSKSMQAFLATVPPLYQINGKTVPSGESQVVNDKDWGYVLSSEPQTLRPQSLNFYRYHPHTIQQAEAK